MTGVVPKTPLPGSWNHSSDDRFIDYYERQSLSSEKIARFTLVRDKAIALLGAGHGCTEQLDVVDIGCGSGTQCRLWARQGHRVRGLDVSAPLIELARQRAKAEQLDVQFDVGSATELPYAGESADVCLLPELLEHVADWQSCLNEAIRILRPGGLLYLSTTNWLCPIQEEFQLPLYSWYPGLLKRRFERLAMSTRPELANHAKYPAVNWFTFYSLAAYLKRRGFRCLDRFDLVDTSTIGALQRFAIGALRAIPPLRFAGHVFTPWTVVFALKEQ
ncbi:class I SAM-dependent methyltransferase [Accumulibacter sp.]|uniref:class I SAM-dependent methyltransferase n=1 Tax=Accumulibacter sp. TaxID=2053492 RepID=UPI002629FDE4|nr:class I SAM-dependent methyltransferase [Accumulibacter sp.]